VHFHAQKSQKVSCGTIRFIEAGLCDHRCREYVSALERSDASAVNPGMSSVFMLTPFGWLIDTKMQCNPPGPLP
jgi:hypothetical protein